MSETRAALKAASEQVARISEEITRLESAAPLAEQAIVDAESDLAAYDDLEQQITKWRTGQLKRGQSTKVLPEVLQEKLNRQRAASEELDRSRATHQAIEIELAELRKKVRQAEADRIKYAVAVLHSTSDGLAEELLALNTRRREIMDLLDGLAEMSAPIGGRMQFIGHSPRVSAAMNSGSNGGFSQWPGGISPLAANSKRWAARLDLLLRDADAEVTLPKPVQPADVVVLGAGLPGSFGTRFELRPEA